MLEDPKRTGATSGTSISDDTIKLSDVIQLSLCNATLACTPAAARTSPRWTGRAWTPKTQGLTPNGHVHAMEDFHLRVLVYHPRLKIHAREGYVIFRAVYANNSDGMLRFTAWHRGEGRGNADG